MRRLAFLLVVRLATAAPSVAATAPPAPPDSEIVVTARLNEVFRSFVTLMTQAGHTDQIARWKDDICPAVIGVAPEQAAFIAQRIVDVGRPFGLRPGGPGCRARMTVVITPDAAQVAGQVVRQSRSRSEPTDYDRSFLAGLYHGAPNRSAKAQRAAIASHMRRDLGRPKAADAASSAQR